METGGEISVPENGNIIRPCSSFRMIATCNTLSGSYAGTYQENIAHQTDEASCQCTRLRRLSRTCIGQTGH